MADIRQILMEHRSGISRDGLLELARAAINPDLTPGQLEAELEMLGDEVVETNGLLSIALPPDVEVPAAGAEDENSRPLRRLVAIDVESVLRYTETQPLGERTIFQVGAVRFGPDNEWAAAAPPFDRFISLSEGLLERITNLELRERITAQGEDPARVFSDLLSFIDGADAFVAYNGRSFDFPLLDDALARAIGDAIPGTIARVDGLYIALSIWPVPPRQHALSSLINLDRFDAIKDRLQIDLTGLIAHDAADDAKMLAELMRFAAAEVDQWPDQKRQLARSVGARSTAWRMLFGLTAAAPNVRQFDTTEMRAALADMLAVKPPIRPNALPKNESLSVQSLVGSSGEVDIDRLVSAVMTKRGRPSSTRQSQRDMVAAMRGWVRSGTNALVEAPTGTGKSFAILAIALDWLAAGPRNKVVISTYTRQLQRQLANDILDLHDSGAAPGLIGATSLIKGALNRLSLAGLVRALADATDPPKRRRRGEYVGHPLFAELALYLCLRLVATGTPVEEWEAHSVDPVDIEPFFEDYLKDRPGPGGMSRRGSFLRYLSQAESGDYPQGEGAPSEHTSSVKEVLGHHRLLVTNHALLLSHLKEFEESSDTLLIVDEAHSLENAATSALEVGLEYGLVEDALQELRDWMRPPTSADPDEQTRYEQLVANASQLANYLDFANVPLFAAKILDSATRDALRPDALRSITVASAGTRVVGARDNLVDAIGTLGKLLDGVLAGISVQPARHDRIERERGEAVEERVRDLAKGAAAIFHDLQEIRAPSDPTAEPSNRVVWVQEQFRHGPRPRDLRFTIATSPVELARDPEYGKLADSFSRAYYISATLRVDNSFDFIRRRLGLAESVQAIELPSPFDLEKQALLVTFSDFPSWAEQEQAAIRSVAQQVGRFLGEVAHGNENGAMVLTTSRSAANQIYEQVIVERGRVGGEFPISSASYLGTASAVDEFRRRGGALVGTKGLWQGVDIDDPSRLRMVWINKLPFAVFGDPVIAARMEVERRRAEEDGDSDPDGSAVQNYYLPLAAMELRQAVGRLIRSPNHRGVVIISDRKLAGPTRLHRRYRQVFLGSLDGMVRNDDTWGVGGGNIRTMADGWRDIWNFFGTDASVITETRAEQLTTPDALDELTLLPSIRAIRAAALTDADLADLQAQGQEAVNAAVLERYASVAGQLREGFQGLRNAQVEALTAVAQGSDLLALLPTSAGKSFIYQLPAFALPGVTIVVSPLVALMTDQALGLNRSVGGAVRALVAPMRESNSRTGKAEVADALTNPHSPYGIRLIYISPERLCQRQFQEWILEGVRQGVVRRIAIDEAHTFVTWGEDFRPSFRRAERFLARLRAEPRRPQLLALTATATPSVRKRLRMAIFGLGDGDPSRLAEVTRNPIRPELALYRRMLGSQDGGPVGKQRLLEALLETVGGHAIVYTLTIKEARTIHAALVEHFGESSRQRIRLFHGRMTASEKESVARDFVNAPKRGDEDFDPDQPMIVVATAAFGLGVDRKDIRAVVVASPPADLAALYQELGRAGRDGEAATGIMLGSGRAWRTLIFMEQLRAKLDPATYVAAIADRILRADGPVDVEALATEFLNEDVALGRRSAEEAEAPETLGNYKLLVVRVVAALATAGVIEDNGDFPDMVRIRVRDDAPLAEADLAEFVSALTEAIGDEKDVELVHLNSALAARFPEDARDPGELWVHLLELHSLGYLDVSQQSTRRQLTSIQRLGDRLPAEFARAFVSDVAREERERLLEFFVRRDAPTCVNDDFRLYFQETELPAGTCDAPECRCSGCWLRGKGSEEDIRPPLLAALTDMRARPNRNSDRQRALLSRISRNVERLLRVRWKPLHIFLIEKTLRGQDRWKMRQSGEVRELYPELVNSAVFGAIPDLRRSDLEEALERLEAAGRIEKDPDSLKFRWVGGTRRQPVLSITNDESAPGQTQLGLELEQAAS